VGPGLRRDDGKRYCFLTPDISTTLRQRAVSAVSMAPNSVALPVIGMAPSSAMRCLMVG
jgi:hypothetical protein